MVVSRSVFWFSRNRGGVSLTEESNQPLWLLSQAEGWLLRACFVCRCVRAFCLSVTPIGRGPLTVETIKPSP